MEVRIIIETTFENGMTKARRLGCLSRPSRRTQPEGFGLLLEDARTILGQLQNAIFLDQIAEVSKASRMCPDCYRVRAIHDGCVSKVVEILQRRPPSGLICA